MAVRLHFIKCRLHLCSLCAALPVRSPDWSLPHPPATGGWRQSVRVLALASGFLGEVSGPGCVSVCSPSATGGSWLSFPGLRLCRKRRKGTCYDLEGKALALGLACRDVA